MTAADRLDRLRVQIAEACERSGRAPGSVTLVGISKFHPASAIREAAAHGLQDFGENYVQEWRRKADELVDLDIRWHFTGHLQSNKVKYLVGRVSLIHSVDSAGLIEAVARQSEKAGVVQEILLEVNLSGDAGKTGVPEGGLAELMEVASRHEKQVRLRGLMCMGPLEGGPEAARPVFRRLKELAGKFNIGVDGSPPVLSMGMSEDFGVAIEEGATHIRIGTGIFGPRPAKPAQE